MEPYIVRRQKEVFGKGAMDQMSRQGVDEIRASKGGFTKIFGPTSYEQGAIFYSANRNANDLHNEVINEMPTLRKMPPAEFQKYIADKMQGLETGDPFTDQATQAAIFETLGAVTATHAKANYLWGQEEAKHNWSGNSQSAATLLANGVAALAGLTDPGDEETTALAQLADNFAASAIQPAGMDDAVYKDGMYDLAKGLAQSGNGFAVHVLTSRGLMAILDEDKAQRLDDQITKYGKKAQSDLILQDPELQKRINLLEMHRIDEVHRPSEVQAEALALNAYATRKTGFDMPLFDANDIRAAGKSVIEALHAEDLRTQARNDQLADRLQDRQWDREDKAEEIAAKTAAASAAYTAGRAQRSQLAGIGDDAMYNTLANNDFVSGNYKPLLENFKTDNWVSASVKNTAQAEIRSVAGDGQYSKAVGAAYERWKAVRDVSPSLASAIYGSFDLQLTNYDKLISGNPNDPITAYNAAFLNPSKYRSAQMPVERRKEAGQLLASVVNSEGPWRAVGLTLPFQRTAMNTTTKKALGDLLWDDFAVRAGNSRLPNNVIASQVLETAVRSGRFERYGALGWTNQSRTIPLSTLLNLQQDEADKVVTSVIDKHMRASGFSSGASGDNYEITRVKGPDGNLKLYVLGYDDDHPTGTGALIPFSEFKRAADSLKKPTSKRRLVNTTGRVAGEDVGGFH